MIRSTGFFLVVLAFALINRSLADFNLTILHTNDVHCRFEQANKLGAACSATDAASGKCFGGFPRLVTIARQIRAQNPNTVLLNAGDFYQGTNWYTIHKWRVVSHFTKMLNLTAMSLGNHEFDDGVRGLVPFIQNANFPIVGANVDTSREPSLNGLISKSTVVNVDGKTIGIIGYLTLETNTISSVGNVVVGDEIAGVRAEAQRLKEQGVDILIALGHAGITKDMEIAQVIPEIDVVVGGHTNTFLWNGPAPSSEEVQGPYPIWVQQPSGKMVPVVQAYGFGKYMGRLDLVFNDTNGLIAAAGQPIMLGSSVQQDPAVLAELVPWQREIDAVAFREVGKTKVFLDGRRTSCRMVECNLGNLIADSYVHLFRKYAGPGQWSKVSMAILNGGAVRTSVDELAKYGTITYGDVLAVAPFPNTVDLVKLSGRTLRQVFEYSVLTYDPKALEGFGGFLQVSGIQVTYDLTKPAGQRVVELLTRCATCRVPTYTDVVDDGVYEVAMSSYLAGGGDGYSIIKNNIIERQITGVLDYDAVLGYIEASSPVIVGLERRIRFLTATSRPPCQL